VFFIGARLGSTLVCTQYLGNEAPLVGAPHTVEATEPEAALALTSDAMYGWEAVLGLLPGGGVSRFTIQPLGTWPSQFNGILDIDWSPTAPGPVVAREVLRLPLRHLELAARGWINTYGSFLTAVDANRAGTDRPSRDALRETIDLATGLGAEPRRPGRRGHAPEFLARVAHVYAFAVERGEKGVVNTIARSENVTPGTVHGWIQTARRRGYLTAAPKGRQGGQLTDLAREVLEQSGR